MTNRRTFLTRLAALAAAPFVMLESGVRKVCGKPKVKPPVIVASAFGNSFSNNTIICEDGSIWSGDPGMKSERTPPRLRLALPMLRRFVPGADLPKIRANRSGWLAQRSFRWRGVHPV
jgi:hypothetical protein